MPHTAFVGRVGPRDGTGVGHYRYRELEIAQEEQMPYFLLKGYSDKTCYKPKTAKSGDKKVETHWTFGIEEPAGAAPAASPTPSPKK